MLGSFFWGTVCGRVQVSRGSNMLKSGGKSVVCLFCFLVCLILEIDSTKTPAFPFRIIESHKLEKTSKIHLRKETNTLLAAASFQADVESDDVSPQHPLLRTFHFSDNSCFLVPSHNFSKIQEPWSAGKTC